MDCVDDFSDVGWTTIIVTCASEDLREGVEEGRLYFTSVAWFLGRN